MAKKAERKDPTKELRLGVVCYGGSSLAIYMHGVTKELNRLVKASALLDADLAPQPDARSEAFYIDLLRRVADDSGVRTRVVVDVVAGTSAGGINGIYLTKAIAHNLSQDALRDVWFDKGDMKELLLLPKSWPVKLRFALLLPRALKKSPLRGNEMAQWLFGALEEMDEGGSQPPELETLVPRDNRLDLFVTITDFYGYDRQIAIADPRLVHDQRHRHALTFTYGPGKTDQFQPKNNGALAFAGRATSCFPGVFPPVSFKAFQQWVPKADLSDLRRCFRSHILAGARPEDTQFVDGGVLDNKPFGWAISAIQQRRADVEVDRRLLYLQPDPGDRFVDDSGKATEPGKPPATVAAIMAAISGLPRQEPILDDLLDVSAHNERVDRIRDGIETSFSGVAGFVEAIVGAANELPSDPESAEFTDWAKKINEQTIAQAGLAYATYLRLKISATVDRYAQSVCDVCDFPADSNHAQLVRAVLREWAEERKLFQQEGEPTQEQLTFLRDLDLGYGQRRLRFVTSPAPARAPHQLPGVPALGRPALPDPGARRRGGERRRAGAADEPYEATVLSTAPKDKVEAKKLMHFWGFFDRHARENDYLWGRLDGAAHLIGILLDKNHPDYRATCLRAFAAILDEDESALPNVPERVRAIRAELSG